MNITLIQADLVWNDPAANRNRFEREIFAVGETDLVVLPEMFPTGFCTRPREAAEPDGGPTLAGMRRTARKKGAALAGSVAVEQDGRYFNRFYFVRPRRCDGTLRQTPPLHLRRRAQGIHRRRPARDRGIQRLAHPAASLLRPAVPGLVAQPGRLRHDSLRSQLADAARRSLERAAQSAGDRKRLLRGRGQPGGRRSELQLLRRDCTARLPRQTAGRCRHGGQPATLSAEADKISLTTFREKFPALQDADPFTLNI